MSTMFVARNVPVKTPESAKITRLANRIGNKASRSARKPSPCVVVYSSSPMKATS